MYLTYQKWKNVHKIKEKALWQIISYDNLWEQVTANSALSAYNYDLHAEFTFVEHVFIF